MKRNQIIVFLISVFCFFTSIAQVEVMVNSLGDDDVKGTLRWAINAANADG